MDKANITTPAERVRQTTEQKRKAGEGFIASLPTGAELRLSINMGLTAFNGLNPNGTKFLDVVGYSEPVIADKRGLIAGVLVSAMLDGRLRVLFERPQSNAIIALGRAQNLADGIAELDQLVTGFRPTAVGFWHGVIPENKKIQF